MSRTTLTAILALSACALRPFDDQTGGADTTTTGASTSSTDSTAAATTSSPTTTAAATTAESTAPASTSSEFIPIPDGGPPAPECDLWTENCPEGQKCMPASLDGDSFWDTTLCVPLVPDPDQLYEPCTAGPVATGEDSCAKHLMCWNVDPDTKLGTCFGMCTGTPDSADCEDPGASCIISRSGPLMLCIPDCDPLMPDCADGDVCIWTSDRFSCVIDASGDEGQAFDPCEYANQCDPGLACHEAKYAAECDPMAATGCCLPFCDTTGPNTCPGEDQICTPWWEEGQAPPGDEHIGLCALPI